METIKLGNTVIRILQDDSAEDPRTTYDHLGKMVCWHSRYDLGDENPFKTPDDFSEFVETEDIFFLRLFLYDHSGLSMNTDGFSCRWDSGQVGFIYINKGDFISNFGAWDQEKATDLLKSEVVEYDHFLRGNCFGYTVSEVQHCNLGHEHENEIDSCWGFIGDFDQVTKDVLGELGLVFIGDQHVDGQVYAEIENGVIKSFKTKEPNDFVEYTIGGRVYTVGEQFK